MDWTSLAFMIGNLLGLYLKRQAWYANRYIPGALLALNILIQLLLGTGVPVARAETLAHAGLWGSLWPVVLNAVIDTLKAIGLYEAARNAKKG